MKRPIKQKNITRNEQFLYINSLSSEFHDRLKNYKNIPETVDDYESKMSLTEKEDRLKNQISESTKLMKLINSREMENDLNDLKDTYNNPRYIQHDFNKTRYCEIGSFRVFYNKMHKDNEIFRKGGKDLQTPSFNFIRQSVKNRIVPNPIGVVRRKGENSMDFHLTKEQLLVQKMYREFAENEVKPLAAEIDEEERFPMETVEKMAKLGMMGMYFPKEYGGQGASYLSYVMAVEELSKVCGTTGVILSAHTSLCANPIYDFGTEAQKKKYLPKLCSGEWLGAFGLTEPGAGTDAADIRRVKGNLFAQPGIFRMGQLHQEIQFIANDPFHK